MQKLTEIKKKPPERSQPTGKLFGSLKEIDSNKPSFSEEFAGPDEF